MRTLAWLRAKDLRVDDHGPLREPGAVPVFVGPVDPRLGPRLGDLAGRLEALGSGLVHVDGAPETALADLAARLNVQAVHAHGFTEPWARETEARVAAALAAQGVTLHLHGGETLVPPGSLATQGGAMFRVFTAFQNAFQREARVASPEPAPARLAPLPEGLSRWPAGASLDAEGRLADFLASGLASYVADRDRLDRDGTSGLSADLACGALSPARCWQAAAGRPGAWPWQRQLLWREFALHLLDAWPQLLAEPFQAGFTGFPWAGPGPAFEAWVAGMTGYPVVDAAARQLLATGQVHNRARMIAACFLTKHLGVDYRLGEAHYLARLADADPANNNLGWQWSAGCGCDAQPWFRVFNPVLQGRRFDPEGTYVRTWVPELAALPARWIHAPWEAPAGALAAAGITLGATYPAPLVDAAAARTAFLARAKRHLARLG